MNGIERVIFNFKELCGNGTLLAVFFLALLILWLHEEQKENLLEKQNKNNNNFRFISCP